jgi:hypothetical protein
VYANNSIVRNVFLSVSAGIIFLTLSAPSRAEDCATALGGTSGFTSLSSGGSTGGEKRVDEWDGEVVKIRTTRPGVLTISGDGTRSQSALYADAASGPPPLVDSAQLGTDLKALQAVIPAGDHCIAVIPPAGATGDFAIEASFVDVCHLDGMDDHGDSFLCATALTLDLSASGEIDNSLTADDVDMFSFVLGAADTVSIASTGTTDVTASLYDEDGVLIDSDDNGGSSPNFEIVQSLGAGRYYVRVEGAGTAEGAYGIEVAPVP